MRTITLIICLLSVTFLHSQTVEEWTKQRETQIKYLLQQIAALKVYTDYTEKGYDIVKGGLNTIRDIKTGDFNLHNDFFNALKDVNLKIKNSAKVTEIIAFRLQIMKEAKLIQQRARQSGQFINDEIGYFKNVFDHLLADCDKDLDELIAVTTSGQVESGCYRMSDDERIKRIDGVYDNMQEKLLFCKSFSKEISLLAVQRMVEDNEVNHSKKLLGLQ